MESLYLTPGQSSSIIQRFSGFSFDNGLVIDNKWTDRQQYSVKGQSKEICTCILWALFTYTLTLKPLVKVVGYIGSKYM